ncbi:hypothetical protein PoB_000914900 [Plakobranchus ocellatus]|uniref:Uncharacterized protein n=1 Tax=Plakobranchus ocellatus TaxID=259542 RepID=A0AAV3YKR1_9GAST|nr:hypothetical protein PoB_000914900 [Plakobranchus ocellatus]
MYMYVYEWRSRTNGANVIASRQKKLSSGPMSSQGAAGGISNPRQKGLCRCQNGFAIHCATNVPWLAD